MQKIVLRKSKFFDKTNNIKLFKGEKNADYLQILIPTIYNNIELIECNVRLTYITPDNNEHSFLIDEYKQDGFYKDTYISYLINIEERFTSLVGEISLYITITDSNENVVLKSDTTYLTIDEHPKGENGITPEEIEIIDQVVLISNEAKQNSLEALGKSSEALENSEEAKQIAQSVRDDADNGVFDGEDGYTPVKGIDYFTEQEIEEIEQGAAEKVDLSNYVEKEQGKGLSSNDYTSEEKDKLASLENYDDSEIKENYPKMWVGTASPSPIPSYYPGIKERDFYLQTLDGGYTSKLYVATNTTFGVNIVWRRVDVTVDVSLDPQSVNPLSNRAITNALAQKVDAVTGKGLSTEDFTTEEKTKLASLENYDDTEIKQNTSRIWMGETEPDSATGGNIAKSGDLYIKYTQRGDVKFVEKIFVAKVMGEWWKTWSRIDISIDSTLDDTSTNPVQNKVVKAALDELEMNKADKSEIPDVSEFITNSVNNLLNYYLKTETYTKAEVNNLISAIQNVSFLVVNQLPDSGVSNIIYLVPSLSAQVKNVKDEYIWINNAWEQIGSTAVDLSNYVTIDNLNTALSNYTSTTLMAYLNMKQDVIDSFHKLSSDYVDDTNSTNKFVSSSEKETWNNKVDKVTGKGLSTNDYSDAEKKKVSDIIGSKKNNVVLDLGTIEQGNFGGQNENLSNAQTCRTSLLEVDLNTKLNISLPENIKYVIFYGDTPTYSASNQLRQLNSTWTDETTANISSKYIRIKFSAYDGGGNRINITPDMLEDVEITYDSFEAIPSHIYEDKVVRVASNTATDIEKQYADLICDGVGDETEINQGLQFLASIGGGALELSSGTFFLDNFTVGSDGVYRAIQFPNVDGVTISIKGKGGMVKDNLVGTCIDLSYAAYTSLDNTSNNQYELFGQDVTTTLSSTVLYMSDIRFRSPQNQKKFIFIDLYNFGRVELTHVYVYAFKNVQGSNISPAIEGLIGIRMLRGSNFGTENNYLSCGVNGCYEGWQVGSEHVYMRQCSAIYNVYGYTFGNYQWTNAFLHPIVMIKCTDERNINLPLFKKCGFYDGSVNKGQRIDMIDFSIERKTAGTPGHTLGNLAIEETDGTFNGEITFTMLNNSNINCVDVSFFQSGGSNFKIRNSAQKLYGTNTLRDSYAANQWQEFYSTDDSCLYRYVNGQWVKDYDDTSLKNAIGTINDILYPRITKQPDDIYAKLTQGRNISISAEGNNLSYQWQISDNQGASWTDSAATGYNTNTLSIIVGSRIYDGRLYRCKVTDGNGTILYSDTCQVIIDDSARITSLETQLGGNSIVVIEESDYESLVTPDENTIYLITEDSV